MDDDARAVLAALAELKEDDDATQEPTAEVLAARAGIPFAMAAATLERLTREGLVLVRPVAYFTGVQQGPSASPPRYALSARGRGVLEDAGEP